MRERIDIERAIDLHGNTVWRVCVLYFRQSSDAQDAFQEAYLKYSLSDREFSDNEHQKAWLIRVATNVCKDMLKAAHRTNVSLDGASDTVGCGSYEVISSDIESQPGSVLSDVRDALKSLSDPPRTPLYLSLYEGYSAPEIAEILDAPVNTVYSWVARGKQQLREVLA